MEKVIFNPNLIVKKLVNVLDERPRDILMKRFGLQSFNPSTLESIGREYGITRERVRQIEAFALNKIHQSDQFDLARDVFNEMVQFIEQLGGVVEENDFLTSFTKKEEHKNPLLFLLVVGDDFYKIKETDHHHHLWTTDLEKAEKAKRALQKFHDELDPETLLSEKEIVSIFEKHLKSFLDEKLGENITTSLLKISRMAAPNALGEWGLASSPHIKPRGMRDYAFLVMRKHGSPMHFSETAKAITDLFNKPAHVQTVHNEVIKDDRFVLVGRGLYALKEWGYEGGIVRKVIENILNQNDLLSKEDIIKKVLKERYVKENTILVNLQNKNYFKKDAQGHYTLL